MDVYESGLVTELMIACGMGDKIKVLSLIEQGVNLNIKNVDGRTPLMEAAWYDRSDIIKILVEHGSKINETIDNLVSNFFSINRIFSGVLSADFNQK